MKHTHYYIQQQHAVAPIQRYNVTQDQATLSFRPNLIQKYETFQDIIL